MANEEVSVFDKIIIENTLEGVGSDRLEGYLSHALCLEGAMEFDFNGRHFIFSKGWLLTVLSPPVPRLP